MASQAEVLFEFWQRRFKWFIVGGTADGDEAQCVHERYPDVRCIGFEPNPEFARMQNEDLGFPGHVYPHALWNCNCHLQLTTPMGATERSASVCLGSNRPDMGGMVDIAESRMVSARTLDELSNVFGFENAVLWIDIEGAELSALQGAERLLSSGAIKLINLETYVHREFVAINEYLHHMGFLLRKVWNSGLLTDRDAQDYIYLLED
jgi:FkbM family methyltransferase